MYSPTLMTLFLEIIRCRHRDVDYCSQLTCDVVDNDGGRAITNVGGNETAEALLTSRVPQL